MSLPLFAQINTGYQALSVRLCKSLDSSIGLKFAQMVSPQRKTPGLPRLPNLGQRPQVSLSITIPLGSKCRQFLQSSSIWDAYSNRFKKIKRGKENPLSLPHFQQICWRGSFCIERFFHTAKGAEGKEGHPSAPQPVLRRILSSIQKPSK
jgi:hypothetical protein